MGHCAITLDNLTCTLTMIPVCTCAMIHHMHQQTIWWISSLLLQPTRHFYHCSSHAYCVNCSGTVLWTVQIPVGIVGIRVKNISIDQKMYAHFLSVDITNLTCYITNRSNWFQCVSCKSCLNDTDRDPQWICDSRNLRGNILSLLWWCCKQHFR